MTMRFSTISASVADPEAVLERRSFMSFDQQEESTPVRWSGDPDAVRPETLQDVDSLLEVPLAEGARHPGFGQPEGRSLLETVVAPPGDLEHGCIGPHPHVDAVAAAGVHEPDPVELLAEVVDAHVVLATHGERRYDLRILPLQILKGQVGVPLVDVRGDEHDGHGVFDAALPQHGGSNRVLAFARALEVEMEVVDLVIPNDEEAFEEADDD